MGEMDRKAIDEKVAEGVKAEKRAKRKARKEKMKKERTSFFTDFKKFITKGNVLDMAVGVVIATAFNAIVNGLVKYIITPCITYLTSGKSIEEWELVLREEGVDAAGEVIAKISVQYGLWLQTIVDFLIIAFSIFVAVRTIRGIEKRLQAKEIAEKEAAAAKQKAEDEAKAAAAAEALAKKAEAERLEKEDFLRNVREQSELLRDIREALKK